MHKYIKSIINFAQDIKNHDIKGMILFFGKSGIFDEENWPESLKEKAECLLSEVPDGFQIVGWFNLQENENVNGEISLRVENNSTEIIFDFNSQEFRLYYPSKPYHSFSSDSDKLLACAMPINIIRNIGTKHDDAISGLIEEFVLNPVFSDLNQSGFYLTNIPLEIK